MAIFSNKNNDNIIPLGSKFKLNINMDQIDGFSMEDINFFCTFKSNSENSVTLQKSSMKQIDENNYVAPLNSLELGKGTITIIYEADIPDNDFDDSFRHEVVVIKTDLRIV